MKQKCPFLNHGRLSETHVKIGAHYAHAEAATNTKRVALKLCLVGPQRQYPAFDSVSSILKVVLGWKQITELRISDWSRNSASPLRFLFPIVQDFMLCLKITSCRKRKRVNTVLLFQSYYPLSCVLCKLSNIRLIIYIGGSDFHWSYLEHTSMIGKILAYVNLPIQTVCHSLADLLISLSKNMVKVVGLEKYEYKTRFALPRLDQEFYNRFKIRRNYEQRDNVVGFVGEFCKRKGILDLLKAVPFVTGKKADCRFLFVGGGPLLETVRAEAQRLGVTEQVDITGFVGYDCLQDYYNEMKLYVLPAYAEGIPSTIFESMACGTPVLATPVGGIPDVIEDGKTGFLLDSSDPTNIAERIIELLDNHEILKDVSSSGSKYVRECSGRTWESWRKILQNFSE